MKIDQLAYGARFEYKGEEYVKTGPMFGTGPHGPRVIPRSAILRPIAETTVAAASAKTALRRADVLCAFDSFYADCQALVSNEQRAALALLRDRFLQTLDGVR